MLPMGITGWGAGARNCCEEFLSKEITFLIESCRMPAMKQKSIIKFEASERKSFEEETPVMSWFASCHSVQGQLVERSDTARGLTLSVCVVPCGQVW